MARMKKKGECGAATTYISRKQALKKLQLSLKDFRRLCILKGIYPVEPKHKKKVNKNNSTNKTYFILKDIQFLAQEPLIEKFRNFKIFLNRLKRAIGKKDQEASSRLRNNEPIFSYDHVVKERYPTFIDSLRDLDDALSTSFLFRTFPKGRVIKTELIDLCGKLTVEFMHYVIESRSLRKVFVSIKGIYYQAEIMGQIVIWLVPHTLGYKYPTDVDFKIMVTFADFYSTMLGFVNFRLFNSINMIYPPKLTVDSVPGKELLEGEDDTAEYVAALNLTLRTGENSYLEEEVQIDEFPVADENGKVEKLNVEAEGIKKLKGLFEKCKIFINREVPRESLVFVIRACGGQVSFDKTLFIGSTFDENDETITHQIVDRPQITQQYLNRYYVQPQWIYDCINFRTLLPVQHYFPGVVLPPHLSPFVEEKEGDYISCDKQLLMDMQKGITKGLRKSEVDSDDDFFSENDDKKTNGDHEGENEKKAKMSKRKLEQDISKSKKIKGNVVAGTLVEENVILAAEKQAAEEKRLAIMMMPKKKKHLYDKIIYGQKRKNREVEALKSKRLEYNKQQKLLKKLGNK